MLMEQFVNTTLNQLMILLIVFSLIRDEIQNTFNISQCIINTYNTHPHSIINTYITQYSITILFIKTISK